MTEGAVAIIDYGMGNLASVYNAFVKTGYTNVVVTSSPEKVRRASKMVLPGVGAFEDAMKNLRASGLDTAIKDSVGEGRPLLGICLGFQLVFERSYENGVFEGLGILEGDVVRFDVSLPVPHMGWNEATFARPDGIFRQFEGRSVYFYFDHGYYPKAAPEIVVATTEYEIVFPSVVSRGSVYATQFHPEKSHKNGLSIIKAYAEI